VDSGISGRPGDRKIGRSASPDDPEDATGHEGEVLHEEA